MNSSTIVKSLEAVTGKWTRQRKQEERGRAQSRRSIYFPKYRMSIKEAAWQVMPDAYAKVSDNGRLPAQVRQLMYASRRSILESTGRSELNSQYFSQVIVPEYLDSHPHQTANWDVVYDARGHFEEPHTELVTPLGTLDVRDYLADVRDHAVKPLDVGEFLPADLRRFPTCGPDNRCSALLFIEKEGFMPLFKATRLAERYDIAIMSTKGMPVVACRRLVDELCGNYGIPLLVLHDFDKAGFSIFGTLDGRSGLDKGVTRYQYHHHFEVIDLGIRLADVLAYNLESEPVQYQSDPSWNLESNGATPEEMEFLCGGTYHRRGRRVELNAFTSGDFMEWIETKLREHGIEKVIPDAATLETAYRRAVQISFVRRELGAIVNKAAERAVEAKLPENLDSVVREGFKADPTQSWDQVIAVAADREL